MKKIFFVILVLWSAVTIAQAPNYLNFNERRHNLAFSTNALNLPAGATPAKTTGQYVRSGAIFYDSTGADSGLYVSHGTYWVLIGGNPSAGGFNTSLGSGYKIAVDGTNNVKSILPYNGLSGDSAVSGTVRVGLGGTMTKNDTINTGGNQLVLTGGSYTAINLNSGSYALRGVAGINGVPRVEMLNTSNGISAAAGFTAYNDEGGFYGELSLTATSSGYSALGLRPSTALFHSTTTNGIHIAAYKAFSPITFAVGKGSDGLAVAHLSGVINGTTGNWILENGTYTPTDNGQKLQVTGSTRISDSVVTPGLVRVTDTTGFDVDMIDRATGNHKKLYAGLIGSGGGGSGTVTSVDPGYGLIGTPDPITTSGTVILDTTIAVNKAGAQVISGIKNFTSMPTFSTLTLGRVVLVGTNGALTDDAGLAFTASTNELKISGPATSLTLMPKLGLSFDSDADAVQSAFAYNHDNTAWMFDAWYNGSSFTSSHAGSNFAWYKSGDELAAGYNAGTAKGSTFASFNITNGLRLSKTGTVGIGTAPSAKLHVLSTTEQLRLSYDASNYLPITVSSGGAATLAPTGGNIFVTGNVQTSLGGVFNSSGGGNDFRVESDNNANMLYVSGSGDKVGIGAPIPNSTLHINGSFATAYRAITALRTLDATDRVIEVTANTFTVTLPTAVGITGREYIITNSGSGTITIATTSSQTFVNVTATPTTLTVNQFGTVKLISNGANWLRVSAL